MDLQSHYGLDRAEDTAGERIAYIIPSEDRMTGHLILWAGLTFTCESYA